MVALKVEKPRHLKDQFRLIINTAKAQDKIIIQKALTYYNERKLFSAGMLKDSIEYLKIQQQRQLDIIYLAADISTPFKVSISKTRGSRHRRIHIGFEGG